ncbi:hypothetical protein AB8O64_14000 [Streptomyces sp. QH1-20]|uniref:hypothetical protein n=1 Tax=Streptomyces sp. QH1-20 TaxID=3240934 RepID=UPI0035161F9E
MHIYQPNAPWAQLDLKRQSDAELESLRELREFGEEIPYRIDESSGLLNFGRSDNGDALFWNRSDAADSDNWTVAIKEARGEEWFEFGGGVVEFLQDFLMRKVRVPVFPGDVPIEGAGFAPYGT